MHKELESWEIREILWAGTETQRKEERGEREGRGERKIGSEELIGEGE